MLMPNMKIRERLAREDGGVTVEFVVLFPVLLALTGMAMDVGFAHFKQSQIQAAVQDITRARSIGTIKSNAEAEAILANRLAQGFTDEAVVDIQITEPLMLSTSVRVPLHDMQLVGFLANMIGDPTIEIGDQQLFENFDIAAAEDPAGTGEDTTMVDGILEGGTTDPVDTGDPTVTPPEGIY